MALIPLPNGAQAALSLTFGTPKTVTAVTNADPAVASSAAHGLADGDYVLVESGWSKIHNSVRRVDGSTTGTFEYEGVDSTDTAKYPAGQGVGSVTEILTWEAITLIPSWEYTGGEKKTIDISYLDVEKDRQAIIGSTAEGLDFSVSYRPDSTMHAALIAASESGEIQALRLILKDGSTLFYPGQIFYNPTPTTTRDEEMVCMGSVALQGDVTRYAAP